MLKMDLLILMEKGQQRSHRVWKGITKSKGISKVLNVGLHCSPFCYTLTTNEISNMVHNKTVNSGEFQVKNSSSPQCTMYKFDLLDKSINFPGP